MIALLLLLFATVEVAETHTGATFERVITLEGTELVLTGVDRRRAFGRDVYAVAHYAAPTNVQAAQDHDPATRIAHYSAAEAPKAIVFRGVYRSVPARGIRWSWENHFKRLDMTPHEGFIEAFQAPFRRGERLYFFASGDGTLTVHHDATHLGTWDDPALVRAFWDMCLGPATEIENPANLVALKLPRAQHAKQSNTLTDIPDGDNQDKRKQEGRRP